MDRNVYEQVLTGLQRNGITVTRKGLVKIGSTGKAAPADGSAIFNAFQVSADEFMKEFKAHSETTNNSRVNAKNNFTEMPFIHPTINALSNWGKADDEIFGRFSFAINHQDDSFIILLKLNESSYTAIPFSSQSSLTIGAIASKCTQAASNKPEMYKNLYEELTVGFRKRMQFVVDKWRAGKFTDHGKFVEELGKFIPHSMLKRLAIKLITDKKTIGGEGDEEIAVFVPCSARFTETAQSLTTIEPIEFLSKYIAVFLGRREMHAPIPKIFTNDPSVPALCYIDLNTLAIPGPCPTWDQYMRRYRPDEAKVFKAFIYGIFVADNTGRQILYILDNGFSAKSMVLAAIIDVLGSSLCISLQKDSLNNQFSLGKVWDKRLVTIGDNKNPNLIMSEKLHMMTGGDYAEIEMKHRNSFHAKLQTKIIASGNTPLDIHPDARHEISRVIIVHPQMNDDILKEFCKLDKNGNVMRRRDGEPVLLGDSTFGDRLKNEFRHFLVQCKEAYEELCPTNSQIVISDEMYDDIISNAPIATTIIQDCFNDTFIYDEHSFITTYEYTEAVKRIVETAKDKNVNQNSVKEYIQKKYPMVRFGVVKRSQSTEGKSVRCVVGLKLKFDGMSLPPGMNNLKPVESPSLNPPTCSEFV